MQMGAIRESLDYVGETFVVSLNAIIHPSKFRFRDFLLAFQRASYEALPISAGIGFLLGLILAFESAAALQMFGLQSYVADLLSFGLFRELGPVMTAIVLAGRSGSAYAAEIGAMKVNEELNALITMGIQPVRFLVLPRVAAAALAMPILTIFAELAGLCGGAVVLSVMDVPPVVYWSHAISTTTVFMILFGLGKSMFFGMLVALIGCVCGLRTQLTADGVGRSSTSAVVSSIVAIALSDGIIAVICHAWAI